MSQNTSADCPGQQENASRRAAGRYLDIACRGEISDFERLHFLTAGTDKRDNESTRNPKTPANPLIVINLCGGSDEEDGVEEPVVPTSRVQSGEDLRPVTSRDGTRDGQQTAAGNTGPAEGAQQRQFRVLGEPELSEVMVGNGKRPKLPPAEHAVLTVPSQGASSSSSSRQITPAEELFVRRRRPSRNTRLARTTPKPSNTVARSRIGGPEGISRSADVRTTTHRSSASQHAISRKAEDKGILASSTQGGQASQPFVQSRRALADEALDDVFISTRRTPEKDRLPRTTPKPSNVLAQTMATGPRSIPKSVDGNAGRSSANQSAAPRGAEGNVISRSSTQEAPVTQPVLPFLGGYGRVRAQRSKADGPSRSDDSSSAPEESFLQTMQRRMTRADDDRGASSKSPDR